MKLLILNNLKSGLGDGAIFDYIRNFVTDGDEVMIRSSDGTTDIRCFLHDADNYDAVIVSGGDGTTATVAHTLADTAIPILPFPAGTANLLSINLALPNESHALEKATRDFNLMDFDLGEIVFPDGMKRGFVLMAGAGYDATIMEGAEDGKRILGQMAYFTSAFSNTSPQHSKISLTLDNGRIDTDGVGVLIINFSRIQFDLNVVHENMPRDGLFDIVVLNTKDAFGLIPAVFAAIKDRSGEHPNRTDAFEIYQSSKVHVEADPPLQVQFDGETVNRTTPFDARILPGAARFIVSDECLRIYDGS